MYIGVELLYKNVGTPQGFLTKRFLTTKAKRTRKMSIWKIRQNDLAFQMNHPVIEVLNEILLRVHITEPNSIRNRRKRRRRRRRTATSDQVLGGKDFLGAIVRN